MKLDVYECDFCRQEFRPTHRIDGPGSVEINIEWSGILGRGPGERKWEHVCTPCRESIYAAIEHLRETRISGATTPEPPAE